MAGGRPTEYNKEKLQKAQEFYFSYAYAEPTTEYIDSKGSVHTVDNPLYTAVPYIEKLALELDVDEDTVANWCKAHEEFFGTIKKIKSLQKLRLYGKSMEKTSSTGAIFQLKVNHDMVETERRLLGGLNGGAMQVEILDKLEDGYEGLGREAQKQMVETNPPIQNQE